MTHAPQTNFPLLASPFSLRGRTLRNRIAHASMTTRMAAAQRVTQGLIDYFESRAKGGASLIVTEPLAILSSQTGEANKVCVYDDREADGLKRWADAIERHDCRLLGQLQEPGRGSHQGRRPSAFSASSLPDALSWTSPRAFSVTEIERVVAEFGAAAGRLAKAGFSGVELSCGHGHLIHQFLSPQSNIREDRYGGDFDGRLRFLRELLQAIRAETPSSFILALKLPGEDGVEGGIDIDLAGKITHALTSTEDIDALSFAQGAHDLSLENHLPDLHWERAPFNEITRTLKGYANGVPVAVLGRIVEPVQAEQALQDGIGDFVQLGRALVADAAWANKAIAGQEPDLRLCVSGNTCWGLITSKRPIGCDNNPIVGAADEAEWTPVPAGASRRVVIVGSGIAGMEAAWIAARRGHDVTVLSAGQSYGGKTQLLSQLPGMEQISSIYDYQIVQATRSGVKFEYGVRAGVDDIMALNPDAVVLATGSTQSWPSGLPADWRGDGGVTDLRETSALLLEGFPPQPGVAVLFDMDHTAGTYAAAQLMASIFEKVLIATPRESIAMDEPLVVRQGIVRRIAREERISCVPLVSLGSESDLMEGKVDLVNVYSGKRQTVSDVALLTYSTPRIPDDGLAQPLRELGVDVRLVGDCYMPRTTYYATMSGAAAGRDI